MQPTGPFDARLAKVLARGTTGEPCPPAEILAAFADRDLDPETLASCAVHVSSCSRCQAIVATVALDEDVLAAESGIADGHPVDARAANVVAFPWRRVVQVAAPLGLAASVLLAVWVARNPAPSPPAEVVAQRNETATPSAPAPAAPIPEELFRTQQTESRETSGAPPAAKKMESRPADPLPSRPAEALDTMAATPAPPAATAATRTLGTLAEAERSAARLRGADATQSNEVAMAPTRFAMGRFDLRAPSGSIRWSVDRGTISRVANAAPPSAPFTTGDDLRGGMALSDRVAWVVGGNGSIWRTTDGEAWTRVPPPASDTLVAVVVTGPDAATVTTEDGRRFTTTDAGRTWAPAAR